jgi:hypothetical protein
MPTSRVSASDSMPTKSAGQGCRLRPRRAPGRSLWTTPLWDAIDEGVTVLASEPGRRAIILVTDGMATGNTHGLDEVIQRAVATKVSVSVVCETWLSSCRSNRPSFHMMDRTGATWTLMHSTFGKPPEANLQKLTAATGGVFTMDGEKGQIPDPGARLARLLTWLHQ